MVTDTGETPKLIANQLDPSPPKRKFINWMLVTILIIIGILIFMELSLFIIKDIGVDRISQQDGLAGAYNHISSFAESPTGDLWVGMTGGVSKIDGENIQSYTEDDGLFARDARNLTVAHDGDLWVNTYYGFGGSQGVSRFNGEDWVQYTRSQLRGRVNTIESDSYGNVWFGTDNGVSKYDGENWETYTSLDGLIGDNVKVIAVSPKGDIWFAGSGFTDDGYTHGLSYFDGEDWKNYTKTDGLAGSVNTIEVDQNGVLWVGTFNGVSRFDGENWITYTMADGLIDDNVRAIAFGSENTIWFGTEKGITQFNEESWFSLLPLSSNFMINDLIVDAQNNLWVASNQGLYKYDTNRIILPFYVRNWQIIRVALVVVIIILLLIVGLYFSNESIKERLRISLSMSIKSVSISFIFVSFFSLLSIPSYPYFGLIILIPIWILAIALTTSIGVFVGLLQSNDFTATKTTAILAGVVIGGLSSFIFFAISRMT